MTDIIEIRIQGSPSTGEPIARLRRSWPSFAARGRHSGTRLASNLASKPENGACDAVDSTSARLAKIERLS
jgi:hypothetical protein